MDAKINKLEEQFNENAINCFHKSNLFAGISIFVNGLTDPSSDELKRIMLSHGGTYHTYQRSHTTFIIASNLPDVKIRNITSNSSSKIIRPQWIVDCLKEERILDHSNYILYTNCTSNQRKMTDFQSEAVDRSDVEAEDTKEEKTADENTEVSCSTVDLDMSNDLKVLNERMKEFNCMEPDDDNNASKVRPSARTAVDSNFLSEFYNNSRLHHISTMGAKFKEYISDLREKHDGKFPGRDELLAIKPNVMEELAARPTIMHIDMDCFFVSVGLRSRPQLRGLPVAVTHSKGDTTILQFCLRFRNI